MSFKTTALSLAVIAAMAQPVSAATLIDFDSVASGATASSAAPSGVSFVEAEFTPDLDTFGDPIAGSEKWRTAVGATDVLVQNPNTFVGGFYGVAPSGTNALDARQAPVLMQFAGGIDLGSFSVTLDNSTFGNLPPSVLLFLNAAGDTLAQLNSDQTVPGYVASLTAPVYGVSSILLSSGALYDNITYGAPVPVPAALPLMLSALGGLGLVGRRRKS